MFVIKMVYRIFVQLIITVSLLLTSILSESYINPRQKNAKDVRYYPRKTLFRKADLIDRGCQVFIKECPHVYKISVICARHYDGRYRTFNNYCEMEYENCNSWRQWSMIKHARCT